MLESPGLGLDQVPGCRAVGGRCGEARGPHPGSGPFEDSASPPPTTSEHPPRHWLRPRGQITFQSLLPGPSSPPPKALMG